MEAYSLDIPLKNLSNNSKLLPDRKRASVFFLHGYGSNKEDMFSLCSFFPKEWVCISLEATIPVNSNGWAWADLNQNNIANLPQPDQMRGHMHQVNESIKGSIKALNLDSKKVNLFGFSLGAALSIYCGLSNQDRYNSIVALCGFIPISEAKNHLDNDKINDFNLFIGNGRNDSIIPLNLAHSTRDGLISIGVKPDYKEYDSSHTINQECLNDVIRWLKDKNGF